MRCDNLLVPSFGIQKERKIVSKVVVGASSVYEKEKS